MSLWREINSKSLRSIYIILRDVQGDDIGYLFSWSRFLVYIISLGRAGKGMSNESNNDKLSTDPLGFIIETLLIQFEDQLDGNEQGMDRLVGERNRSGEWTPEPKNLPNSPSSLLTFSPADLNTRQEKMVTPEKQERGRMRDRKSSNLKDSQDSQSKQRDFRHLLSPDTLNMTDNEYRSILVNNSGLLYGSTMYNTMDKTSQQSSPSKRDWLALKRAEYSKTLHSSLGKINTDFKTAGRSSELPLTPRHLKVSDSCRSVILSRIGLLKKIFLAYSSFGEAEPTLMMNSSNFHRLLKEASLVRSDIDYTDSKYKGQPYLVKYVDLIDPIINTSQSDLHSGFIDSKDAELIFIEFSRIDTRGNLNKVLKQKEARFGVSYESLTEKIIEAKMDFENFIISLQHLALKINPNIAEDKSLAKLIDSNLSRLISTDLVETGFQDLSYVWKLKSILKDDSKVDMMSILYRNIQVYYGLYTNSRNKMDFKMFSQFFKDFGMCPTLISITALQKYFSALVSLEV